MRRFLPVLLVLLAVLGFSLVPLSANASPVCGSLPDCINFSLTGSTAGGNLTLDGYFTYTPPPPANSIYLITGANIWFSDPSGRLNANPPPTYLPVVDAPAELMNQLEYDPEISTSPVIYSYGEDNKFYLNLDPATGTEFDPRGRHIQRELGRRRHDCLHL